MKVKPEDNGFGGGERKNSTFMDTKLRFLARFSTFD